MPVAWLISRMVQPSKYFSFTTSWYFSGSWATAQCRSMRSSGLIPSGAGRSGPSAREASGFRFRSRSWAVLMRIFVSQVRKYSGSRSLQAFIGLQDALLHHVQGVGLLANIEVRHAVEVFLLRLDQVPKGLGAAPHGLLDQGLLLLFAFLHGSPSSSLPFAH